MKGPLSFLQPGGFWLLAALGPLVVLYILKVRRERRVVASTWLWAEAQRDLMAKSPFRRLRAQVPLVVQALAIAALSLALARPTTRHRALLGGHVAIVVDTSASMGAREGPEGRRRIDAARQGALDALTALAPGADAMVLAAGREARVAAPLDRDVKRLQDVVEGLDAEDVEGDLGAAVALAVDRLRQLGGEARVVVFTDGNLAKPESLQGVALPTEVVLVGGEVENTAIVRVDVRAGSDPVGRRDEVQAFALVGHYGAKARDVFVTLRLDGTDVPLASRRLLLQPGERAPVVLTFAPAPGDRGKGLLLEVSPRDALPADDVAYARVPEGRRQPALLVSRRPSPWLERALASDPLVELFRGGPDEAKAARVGEGALYVYDGLCPEAPPAGDFLVVGPPEGACLGLSVGAPREAPSLTSWAEADARFRFLTLDGVGVGRATPLGVEGSAALIRSSEGAIAADASPPGRSGTVLGFDVGDSNWPLRASFVLFVRNVVELARAHRDHGAGTGRAGEALRVAVPPGVEKVRVDGPGGAAREAGARGGLAVVSDVRRAGFYHVSWQGPAAGSALVAVNLASERESDLRARVGGEAVAGARVALAPAVADAQTDWSYLAAALALGLVAFDAFWLTRRARAPRPA
ncbi:MAG TPA: VWA domain-containing protein [Polyangiaceae bacterium]|nr:VWA domain-containing protein [Polyangiaceae bacterium]